MVREGRILISSSTDPDFGADYYVTAYGVGAQVEGIYATGGIPVRQGHGFAADDKFIVASEFPAVTKYRTVTSVTADKIFCASVSVAAGDILVNLGHDTGVASPDFTDARGQGFPIATYSDMEYSDLQFYNTAITDSTGRYRYWHQGIDIWELVQTPNGEPFTVILSAAESTVSGPGSITDNAVARWDTTTGGIQNSVVTIGDTGATTGITTLSASGAVTFGSTLGISGTTTAVAITASGLITGSLGLTITGAVASLATLSVSSTSTFTGAVTLSGGVTGNVASSGNVSGTDLTSGGNIYSSVATVTASTTQTQVGGTALTKDVNNVSVVANANDTVTLPAASAGRRCCVINNGAQTLRIYPASGDNLGAGVDTLTTLTSGSNRNYVAIDSTNWEIV